MHIIKYPFDSNTNRTLHLKLMANYINFDVLENIITMNNLLVIYAYVDNICSWLDSGARLKFLEVITLYQAILFIFLATPYFMGYLNLILTLYADLHN